MSDPSPDRLFVYGTLAPGRSNAHVLAPLNGTWQAATARGLLLATGWAATEGYPALKLDPQGPVVEGLLFSSPALGGFWPELDAFEGEGYRRVTTTVTLPDGETRDAWVYVAAP